MASKQFRRAGMVRADTVLIDTNTTIAVPERRVAGAHAWHS